MWNSKASPGFDINFLSHFPLWRKGFKIYLLTQNSIFHNGFITASQLLTTVIIPFFLIGFIIIVLLDSVDDI